MLPILKSYCLHDFLNSSRPSEVLLSRKILYHVGLFDFIGKLHTARGATLNIKTCKTCIKKSNQNKYPVVRLVRNQYFDIRNMTLYDKI